MRLLEVKNNLIKLTYSEEESPVLGRFLALMTDNKCYVAQFINLKTDNTNHFAVARLLFTFTKDGVVDSYDGSIPDIKSNVTFIPTSELLDLLPIETPVKIGKIAQQSDILSLDTSVFENNLTVFSDNSANIFTFISNCARQLFQMREKVVIIDTDNIFEEYPKFKLGRDFKLPLNSDMIDYLIENETEEMDLQTKAIIQDVLYEIQNYVKSIIPEFIPIDTLINVVTAQFKETKMPELALLKNKLIKFRQANIFANAEREFTILNRKLKNRECIIVDIGNIDGAFQRDVISYLHKKLNNIEKYIYLFTTLNNSNSNKKLLKRLINNNHIFTTIFVNHSYKYVKELKAVSQNVAIFQPQSEQNDFGVYRAFLEKLNMHECVVIGKLTQKVPFIADCSNLELGLTIEDVLGEEVQFVPKEEVVPSQPQIQPQIQTNTGNIDFVTRNAVYQDNQNVVQQSASLNSQAQQTLQVEQQISQNYSSNVSEMEETQDMNLPASQLEIPVETPQTNEEQNISSELQQTEEAPVEEIISKQDTEEYSNISQDQRSDIEAEIAKHLEQFEPEMQENNEMDIVQVEDTSEDFTNVPIEEPVDDISQVQEINNDLEIPALDDSMGFDIPEEMEDLGNIEDVGLIEEVSDSNFEQVTPEIEEMIQNELEKDVTQDEVSNESQPILEQSTIDSDNDLSSLAQDLPDDLGLNLPQEDMADASLLGLDGDFLQGLEDSSIITQDEEPEVAMADNFQEMPSTAPSQEDLILTEPETIEAPASQETNLEALANLALETDSSDDLSTIPGLIEEDDNTSGMGFGVLGSDDLFGGSDLSDMSLGGDLTEADLDFIEETQDIPLGLDNSDNFAMAQEDEELPVYPAEEGEEVESNVGFTKGDTVTHPKYGTGVIEKIIKYGNKTLCSILFEEVGRRLLDPSVSDFTRVEG